MCFLILSYYCIHTIFKSVKNIYVCFYRWTRYIFPARWAKKKYHSCGQVMQDIFFEKQIPNMPFIFLTWRAICIHKKTFHKSSSKFRNDFMASQFKPKRLQDKEELDAFMTFRFAPRVSLPVSCLSRGDLLACIPRQKFHS